MKPALDWYVQRDFYYAIVDEVDSILIDEARTPLIISGPSEENVSLYAVANQVIPRLAQGTKGDVKKDIEDTGDYWVDEEHHSAALTEEGIHKVEQLLAHREPLRPGDDAGAARGAAVADRPHAEEARRRLRGEGRARTAARRW